MEKKQIKTREDIEKLNFEEILENINYGRINLTEDWKLNNEIVDDVLENEPNIKADFEIGLENYLQSIIDDNDIRGNYFGTIRDESIEYITKNIDPDFENRIKNNEELYEDFEDILNENINYVIDLKEIKENTTFEEIVIAITQKDYLEDTLYDLNNYQSFSQFYETVNPEKITKKGVENFKEEYKLRKEENENYIEPINWLIQTQGYELPDLYDENKVENSKFLKSLKEELCNYETELNGVLSISALNCDYECFESVMLSNKDIIVKADSNKYIGIADIVNGGGSGLGIKLEKDLIIPRELIKGLYSVEETRYDDISEIYNFSKTDKDVFRISETPAKTQIKEIDFNKLMNIAKEKNKNNQMTKNVSRI